jgi:hypothetical protein
VLREIIDNVDDRHGMTCTAFYVSGTPDLFDGEKGLTEYEALAARVLLPSDGSHSNPAAAVVDLSLYPLSTAALVEIGNKIAVIHGIAKTWSPGPNEEKLLRDRLSQLLSRNPDLNARMWVRSSVELLDEQAMRS